MKSKLIFAVVFVPGHSLLTVLCVSRWLNYNSVVDPGLGPRLVNLCAQVLSLPLLLPLMWLNPDGDRFPEWFRMASVPANSLLWVVILLFLVGVAKRSRGEES